MSIALRLHATYHAVALHTCCSTSRDVMCSSSLTGGILALGSCTRWLSVDLDRFLLLATTTTPTSTPSEAHDTPTARGNQAFLSSFIALRSAAIRPQVIIIAACYAKMCSETPRVVPCVSVTSHSKSDTIQAPRSQRIPCRQAQDLYHAAPADAEGVPLQ